ncbi:MAG: GntR family transcriptional regulator [Bryobacteraceae bacterium]
MITAIPELKPTAMRQSVADLLRKALTEGTFQPGEGLSEVALAAQMKVSRGPVREALLILAHEGLVSHSQNRGFAVLELTEKDFEEINEVRGVLEASALVKARGLISPEQLQSLANLKDKLVECFRSGDFAGTTQHDLAFHSALWDMCGNSWLALDLKRLTIPYFTFTRIYVRQPPDLLELTLKWQHDLYLHFLQGSTRFPAEECVKLHLDPPLARSCYESLAAAEPESTTP